MVPPVLDAAQLTRIQGTHRGFLYQHLYAALCLLSAPDTRLRALRVERDEDVELFHDDFTVYAQVKTRAARLSPSDLAGVLDRFQAIRTAHGVGQRAGEARFAIVANVELGTTLSTQIWPPDVTIVTPSTASETIAGTGLIVPSPTLDGMIEKGTTLAEGYRLSVLRPDSLVAKLVGLIARSAAGDGPDSSFSADGLDGLFELVAAQVRPLPVVQDYRPQSREPVLSATSQPLVVVGHAGDGKSSWAAEVAAHSGDTAVYLPCSSTPGEQIAPRLVDAVVATLAARGAVRAHDLVMPGRTGLDALALLDRALKDRNIVILAIVDDCHSVHSDAITSAMRAAPGMRWIILGHPSSTMSDVAALAGVATQSLGGWDNDAVASLLAAAQCSANPSEVEDLKRATGGAPLFVLHAVQAIRTAGGDTGGYARSLLNGTALGRSPQEVLLDRAIGALDGDAVRVGAGLASVDLGLSLEEWTAYLSSALNLATGAVRRLLKYLVERRLAYSTEGAVLYLHDAFRPLLTDRLITADERRKLREAIAEDLKAQLLGERAKERILGYVKILAELGRLSELSDIANAISVWIRETGTVAEVRGHLESALRNKALTDEDAFWATDALAYFDIEEGANEVAQSRLTSMATLAATLGEHARGALLHKRVLVALKKGDLADARDLAGSWSGNKAYGRIFRYHAAIAIGEMGNLRGAIDEFLAVADEYLAELGLSTQDVFGKNPPELHSMMDPGADGRDIAHLADCYDAAAKFGRRGPAFAKAAGLYSMWAMKFYDIAGAVRSVLRTGQDVADMMLGDLGDPAEARRFIEMSLLPAAKKAPHPDLAVAVRAQYAVVCAHCEDFAAADRIMEQLGPYLASLPIAVREEMANQQRLIERLRARGPLSLAERSAREDRLREQRHAADGLRARIELQKARARKPGRNERCPCGSGKKYKRCHGLS